MSEQACHGWREADESEQLYMGVTHVWDVRDGSATVAGYCPDCGTRLNADGTETPMVPAVTPGQWQRAAEWLASQMCYCIENGLAACWCCKVNDTGEGEFPDCNIEASCPEALVRSALSAVNSAALAAAGEPRDAALLDALERDLFSGRVFGVQLDIQSEQVWVAWRVGSSGLPRQTKLVANVREAVRALIAADTAPEVQTDGK